MLSKASEGESRLGQRVVSEDGYFGTIRYHGPLANQDASFFGVEWDDVSRGKHSGFFNDTQYFQTNFPNAGSFLPCSSQKITLPRSFQSALVEKYLGDQPSDGIVLFGANQKVQVKTVGWEKIKEKQSHLERLQIVGLAGYAIGPCPEFAQQAPVSELCPFIEDLDLSRNLFVSWTHVADITRQLPRLHSLRLAQNRFLPVVPPPSLENAFQHLTYLTLNSTKMNWADLEAIEKDLPVLEELHFGWNELETFGESDAPISGFKTLRLLNLEHNQLSSWKDIARLAQLPLKNLYLNDNPLKDIQPPKDGFTLLSTLHLHNTLIDSWMSIHHLNSFATLGAIRIKSVPILGDDKDFQANLTARLGKVCTLNGSTLSERRRRDAELWYINCCFKEKGTPDFELKHPRYAELIQIHEEPEAVPLALTSAILKDRLITLSLTHEGKTIQKKLVGTIKVRALRMLMCKLFRFTKPCQVLWKQGPDQILDDEWKELCWYELESGHELVLVEIS